MTRFKSFVIFVLGDIEQVGSEKYFVTITCFTVSLFLLVLCSLHLTLKLNIGPVEIAASASLAIAGLYFLVRFANFLYVPKVILSILGLVMLDITWYYKNLSNGPLLFFILIFAGLIIWVWDGKS